MLILAEKGADITIVLDNADKLDSHFVETVRTVNNGVVKATKELRDHFANSCHFSPDRYTNYYH